MMRWKNRRIARIDSDIAEARRLRAEAAEQRKQLHDQDDGLIATVVRRRAQDGFGEELQVTFTRRSPS